MGSRRSARGDAAGATGYQRASGRVPLGCLLRAASAHAARYLLRGCVPLARLPPRPRAARLRAPRPPALGCLLRGCVRLGCLGRSPRARCLRKTTSPCRGRTGCRQRSTAKGTTSSATTSTFSQRDCHVEGKSMRRAACWNAVRGRIIRYHSAVRVRPDSRHYLPRSGGAPCANPERTREPPERGARVARTRAAVRPLRRARFAREPQRAPPPQFVSAASLPAGPQPRR